MSYKPEDRPLPEELLEDPWFAPIVEQQSAAVVERPAAEPKELEERGVMLRPVAQGSAPDDAAVAAGAASARPSSGV